MSYAMNGTYDWRKRALTTRFRLFTTSSNDTASFYFVNQISHTYPDTVGKWRRRFAEHRLENLWDEPRSGTPRTIEDARIEAVIRPHPRDDAARNHPLEFPRHGAG